MPWCDLDHKANVKGQIMYFLVNASPELLDVAASNFAGALTGQIKKISVFRVGRVGTLIFFNHYFFWKNILFYEF